MDTRWSSTTKLLVLVCLLVLGAWLLLTFSEAIPPLIVAFVLAYLLKPAADGLVRRTGWPRTSVSSTSSNAPPGAVSASMTDARLGAAASGVSVLLIRPGPCSPPRSHCMLFVTGRVEQREEGHRGQCR